MTDEPELEPLDSAESLWRALRQEAGLTRVGRFIVAGVFLASALAAIVGYEWLGFIHRSEHRALLAIAILGAGLIAGPLLALAVAGLDASIRKLFRLAPPSPAGASVDAALLEAWRLGIDETDWTAEAVTRAARLRTVLVAAGYAATNDDGRSWHLTERGIERAEELERRAHG